MLSCFDSYSAYYPLFFYSALTMYATETLRPQLYFVRPLKASGGVQIFVIRFGGMRALDFQSFDTRVRDPYIALT